MAANSFDILSKLDGVFYGEGTGQFPTINPFRYRETTKFEANPEQQLFHK
jgi:hypothetical protein